MRERITLSSLAQRGRAPGADAGTSSVRASAALARRADAPGEVHATAELPAESLALLRAHAAKLLREPANLKPEVYRWAQRMAG